MVFLAESVGASQVENILTGYEELASAIYPFLQHQFQIGESTSSASGNTLSITDTDSISQSISKTHSVGAHVHAGTPVVGAGASYQYGVGTVKSESHSNSQAKGINHSVTHGTSQNTILSHKSYKVANQLEKIEKVIKRILQSSASGLWKYATYIMSNDSMTSKNVANYIRAITQGKESYTESTSVQEWAREVSNDITPFSEIAKYVSHFTHPVFFTSYDVDKAISILPTSYVSTTDVANVMIFPRKSVPGLPVLECVQFGREPHSLTESERTLDIGCAYHMRVTYDGINGRPAQRIQLSKEELTKHTLITGSTGSGKSNAIYTILKRLTEENIPYLVIEPAKGEYRQAIGIENNVAVYGTDPRDKQSCLLRINPFAFPNEIHVLEHLDRLVEIFNVCWPMYAAMPAILKDAIERAYTYCGWDLLNSTNRYDDSLYPTFSDVFTQIHNVLNESDYSAENKGDYIGSLVTRVKSLTNGINGLVFTSDTLSDGDLFDNPAIVDISRVGSSETKSLIMGLLILKLQEYRMSQRDQGYLSANETLKHLTVLEEAHTILRRTSPDQSSESANLQGKTVEMLSNSIAEMRSFGEGFMISDQAPYLLDMSVIRNTNTKIIMRLPDFMDRKLVGQAAGLSEHQITELARLERGVASITQSDWLEPVLCKFDLYGFNKETKSSKKTSENDHPTITKTDLIKKILLEINAGSEILPGTLALKTLVVDSPISAKHKVSYFEYISDYPRKDNAKLRALIYDLFDAESLVHAAENCSEISTWIEAVSKGMPSLFNDTSSDMQLIILSMIVRECCIRNTAYRDTYRAFTEMTKEKEGVSNWWRTT